MDDSLAAQLADAGVIQFGTFTLKSGVQSPFYLDLRVLVSHPPLLKRIAIALKEKVQPLAFDRIAAIPYAAIPIATALSLESGHPLIYTRKEAKSHGMKKMIEGTFHAGETVLVLDDLITHGLSKLEAIHPLTQAGLNVNDIIVIIDREQGGREEMEKCGMRLHSLFTIHELVDALYLQEKISREQKETIQDYLAAKEE
jgi:uridine monophosphate synthetase